MRKKTELMLERKLVRQIRDTGVFARVLESEIENLSPEAKQQLSKMLDELNDKHSKLKRRALFGQAFPGRIA